MKVVVRYEGFKPGLEQKIMRLANRGVQVTESSQADASGQPQIVRMLAFTADTSEGQAELAQALGSLEGVQITMEP